MYCGRRDCYDILDISQLASLKDIKRQYRKLSLEYHPDKNKDPEAIEIFREIATAYGVLSDSNKRAAYDHYLAHPEDYAYNYGMYYRHVYAPKSDLRIVLSCVILILTILQYITQHHRHSQAMVHFRASDKVRRKALAIQQERKREMESSKGNLSKRKGGKDRKKSKELEKQELESIIDELMSNVHISGGYEAPKWQNLLIIRLICLPYTISYTLYWYLDWFVRHTIQNQPYSYDEQVYLTCKKMNIAQDFFLSEEFDEKRDDLISRKLYEGDNYQQYLDEQEEEFKRKYPEKYKRYIRNKKGYKADYGCPDDDEDY